MTDEDRVDAVEEALRRVEDPEVGMDVFEAGLVENIVIDDGEVTIEADLSEFDPESAQTVTTAMLEAVSTVKGVTNPHVEHVGPSTLAESVGLTSVDRIIAVASAKGGVGKTTVAVNLACALAGEGDVGLFDADIHGPNVPSMLELSGPIYADDDGHPMPIESNGLRVMSIGLMEEGAPLAWRGAMAHDALTELFGDTAWGDLDTLVIDLPPGTGDVVLTTLQEVAVDGVVFVTTPFHAAVTDTQRSLELFRDNGVPILGIVVNMGSFTCPSCGDQHELFPGGAPLSGVDVPILAELPFSFEHQGTPTPGTVPETFVTLATGVRDRLDEIGAIEPPEGALDLRGADPEKRRERVRRAYVDLEPGAEFVMLSDRDPTPVRQFLAEVAGVSIADIEPFDVTQLDPDTWRLETVRPA